MGSKEAARRRGNCKRANMRPGWDADIVPDFEHYTRIAAWIIGLAFGVVFMLGLIGG